MVSERKVCAARVWPGDWVYVRERWHRVKAVREERFVCGGLALVLVFEVGLPHRVPASATVLILPAEAGSAAVPAAGRATRSLVADPSASPPICVVECTTCDQSTRASTARTGHDAWCVEHAERTGHSSYRTVETGFLRVVAVPRDGVMRRDT